MVRACILGFMKKVPAFLLALILCLFTSLLLPPCSSAQTFSVTFPKAVSAQPLDGRLLLLLSTDPSDEPRNQIDDSPRTQIVFGVNVDEWQPGQAQVVDPSAWGYPIRSLKDVPAGEYYVQALLNKYETFHRSDGKTVKIFDAQPVPAKGPKGIGGKMGEIVAFDADGFTVVCADGRFKVTRVQADGPKMNAGEFVAGAKLNPGMRFS